jgi:hypothetical protein
VNNLAVIESELDTANKKSDVYFLAAISRVHVPNLIEEIKSLRRLSESQDQSLDMMERGQL